MKFTRTFSACALGALVVGVGVISMGITAESDFLRSLGVFPLLLAMFLLPNALQEWEAFGAVRLSSQLTDDAARLGPSAAPANMAMAERS